MHMTVKNLINKEGLLVIAVAVERGDMSLISTMGRRI